MSEKEYILFCDESDRVGKYYSNAKEALYKTILGGIKKIHPRFNIGVSTGPREVSARWLMPYRHWCFMPNEVVVVMNKSK